MTYIDAPMRERALTGATEFAWWEGTTEGEVPDPYESRHRALVQEESQEEGLARPKIRPSINEWRG